MNCGRVTNQLSAYLDRELTGAEMFQIRRHMGDCAACRAEYDGLAQMKSLLGRLRTPVPRDELVAVTLRRYELAGTGVSHPRRTGADNASRSGGGWHRWLPVVVLDWLETGPGGVPSGGARLRQLRCLSERIPWSRLSLGVTTATLVVVLAFTCIILLWPRHPDALVATTAVGPEHGVRDNTWVLQGQDPLSQDTLGLPANSDGQLHTLPPRLFVGDEPPGSRFPLRWVPASLDRGNLSSFP